MLSVPLRNQGDAASVTIVTIPPSVLKSLDLKIGADLQMDVRDGALPTVPAKAAKRKRYTLAQLLEGATPKAIKTLNDDTARSWDGDAVGRELA
jgi:antitoxin ChpS